MHAWLRAACWSDAVLPRIAVNVGFEQSGEACMPLQMRRDDLKVQCSAVRSFVATHTCNRISGVCRMSCSVCMFISCASNESRHAVHACKVSVGWTCVLSVRVMCGPGYILRISVFSMSRAHLAWFRFVGSRMCMQPRSRSARTACTGTNDPTDMHHTKTVMQPTTVHQPHIPIMYAK